MGISFTSRLFNIFYTSPKIWISNTYRIFSYNCYCFWFCYSTMLLKATYSDLVTKIQLITNLWYCTFINLSINKAWILLTCSYQLLSCIRILDNSSAPWLFHIHVEYILNMLYKVYNSIVSISRLYSVCTIQSV